MQVDTRVIMTVTPQHGVGTVQLPVSREAPGEPWRKLELAKARSATGLDKPTYQRYITQEMLDDRGLSFYGKAYNFNTKYVVDCTAHDIIGSVITLANGKTVHIDMTAESVDLQCNRR